MEKRLVFMAWLTLGLTLLLSSCGDDHREIPISLNENLQTSLKISLAFLSPMVQGDYAVRVIIATADSPDTIINEQSLTLVEAHSQTHNVTIDEIPVGNRRTVTVEIFKAEERLFQGVDTIDITLSGANQLSFRIEKVQPDAVTSDRSIPPISTTPDPPIGVGLQPTAIRMYWPSTSAHKIQRANPDGSNIEDLVTRVDGRLRSIALDTVGGKMYWTQHMDQKAGKIVRANLDGSHAEVLVAELDIPSGIALDVAGGKMYWRDAFPDKIRRANLDGSDVEILVVGPRSIVNLALDLVRGKIYWTEVFEPRIQSSNLDGSNIRPLVSELRHPWGIALDLADGKMYWANSGSGEIQRANLDGSNVEILIGGLDPWALALDVTGDKMYWTDRTTDKIQRANLDGSNVEDLVTEVDETFGIALEFP